MKKNCPTCAGAGWIPVQTETGYEQQSCSTCQGTGTIEMEDE
jgi:DnaJ-class molecular chaperone